MKKIKFCDIFFNMNKDEFKEKIIKVKIDEVNINGEGFCFLDNGTKVCVKRVLPKEEVLVQKTFEKNNFINATLKEVLNKNPLRVQPKCPYYNICGGCDYQHLSSKNALKQKKEIITKYFSDLYNKEIKANKSQLDFNYRNKASFYVFENKVGFQKENSNKLIEIDNCMLLEPIINKALNIFKNWLIENKTKDINHFVIRTLNKKLIVTMVVEKTPKNLDKLLNCFKKEFVESSLGFYLNFNKQKNIILSDKWQHIFGLKFLEDEFEGIKYNVHPYSFLQVNNNVKNDIYKLVLQKIDNQVVIEGYSGAGLLSAILSKKAKKVIGVEINKKATKDAEKLKVLNNINNLENINGDCKTILPNLAKQYKKSIFVIDPPRSGCDLQTLTAIKENKIDKIIYISCNPYTLKQNVKFLGDEYKITDFQIFDMFPQTSNIESVVCLERVK